MELGQRHASSELGLDYKRTVFEKCAVRNYKDISIRGIHIVEQVDMFLMLSHDKSLHYLDLALKPCFRNVRRDHVMFETIRNLPPPCAEYLIAESAISGNTSLGKLIALLNSFQLARLMLCQKRLKRLARNWYEIYRFIFFERFEGLDRIQKRTSIRLFLKTHRILGIRDFPTWGYRFLIRECTSQEPDPALTVELLMTLHYTRGSKIRAVLDAPHESLETMLCHAKIMRFDFWGLWRGIGDPSATFKPCAQIITDCRNPYTEVLLKYGFPYLPDKRVYQRECYMLIGRSVRNRFVITYQECLLLQRKKNWARMLLIMIAFMAFAGFDGMGSTSTDSISTLVCLMRCVPDPYVVPSEMLRELRPIVLEWFVDDLQRITERYAAAHVYGEVYTVHTPRALAHLCRCVIRRAIANNLGLPERINELEVPKNIRKYLSLES